MIHLTKAIFATYDHRNLEKLGKFLTEQGVTILASPESREYLAAFGIPSEDLTTAGPPASILAGLTQGTRMMLGVEQDGAPPPDMEVVGIVAVNLRPVDQLDVHDPFAAMDVANAMILRLAARNPATTIVLVDPDDYPEVIERLGKGAFPVERRKELAAKAIRYQSEYDARVADALAAGTLSEKATMILQAIDQDDLPYDLGGLPDEPSSPVTDQAPSWVVDESERPTMEAPSVEEPEAKQQQMGEPAEPAGTSVSPEPAPEPDEALLAEPRARRSGWLWVGVALAIAVAIIAAGWYMVSGSEEEDIESLVQDTAEGDATKTDTTSATGVAVRKKVRHLEIAEDQITSDNVLVKNAITENREREVKASCPECVQKGTQFLAKDRYRKAIEWYRKALEKDPDDPFVLMLLSLAYHGAHMDDDAIATGKRALEKDPSNLWAMLVVGTTCQMKHDYVCAVQYFDMYLAKAPKDHTYYREIRRIVRRLRPMARRQMERRKRRQARKGRKSH